MRDTKRPLYPGLLPKLLTPPPPLFSLVGGGWAISPTAPPKY